LKKKKQKTFVWLVRGHLRAKPPIMRPMAAIQLPTARMANGDAAPAGADGGGAAERGGCVHREGDDGVAGCAETGGKQNQVGLRHGAR